MSFDQIVQNVMDRLNLTSDDARTRVGFHVNDRYRRITSSIGLQTSRRTTVDVNINPLDADSALPDLEIEDLEKVLRVWRMVGTGIKEIDEYTYDEIIAVPTKNSLPSAYAVKRMGPGRVTITLDAFPPTDEFTLKVEGYDLADTLEGDLEPFIPTDFHDILVAGAMSDELLKMEKGDLAGVQEQKYMDRLSDLRMFIAKSGYVDIMQGKLRTGNLWYRRWFARINQ